MMSMATTTTSWELSLGAAIAVSYLLILSTGVRQSGHFECEQSHMSMHAAWKQCLLTQFVHFQTQVEASSRIDPAGS